MRTSIGRQQSGMQPSQEDTASALKLSMNVLEHMQAGMWTGERERERERERKREREGL